MDGDEGVGPLDLGEGAYRAASPKSLREEAGVFQRPDGS